MQSDEFSSTVPAQLNETFDANFWPVFTRWNLLTAFYEHLLGVSQTPIAIEEFFSKTQ